MLMRHVSCRHSTHAQRSVVLLSSTCCLTCREETHSQTRDGVADELPNIHIYTAEVQ